MCLWWCARCGVVVFFGEGVAGVAAAAIHVMEKCVRVPGNSITHFIETRRMRYKVHSLDLASTRVTCGKRAHYIVHCLSLHRSLSRSLYSLSLSLCIDLIRMPVLASGRGRRQNNTHVHIKCIIAHLSIINLYCSVSHTDRSCPRPKGDGWPGWLGG